MLAKKHTPVIQDPGIHFSAVSKDRHLGGHFITKLGHLNDKK